MASAIAVLGERAGGERRVAAMPETMRKLIALGAQVAVERGAGAPPKPEVKCCDTVHTQQGVATEVSRERKVGEYRT